MRRHGSALARGVSSNEMRRGDVMLLSCNALRFARPARDWSPQDYKMWLKLL